MTRNACFNFRAVKRFAPAALAVLVLVAAGCGGSSKSSAPPATTQAPATTSGGTKSTPAPAPATCRDAPGGLMRRIKNHFILDGGTLSNAQIVAGNVLPGIYFVSARVDGGGTSDKVATWATQQLGATGEVYAVDTWAALTTTYVAAGQKNPDLSVSDPAAYKSRICVDGPKVAKGNDAPLSGRPASGG